MNPRNAPVHYVKKGAFSKTSFSSALSDTATTKNSPEADSTLYLPSQMSETRPTMGKTASTIVNRMILSTFQVAYICICFSQAGETGKQNKDIPNDHCKCTPFQDQSQCVLHSNVVASTFVNKFAIVADR